MPKMRFVIPDSVIDFSMEQLLNKPTNIDPMLVRHEYIDPPFRLRVRNLRIEDGELVGDVGSHYEGLDLKRDTLDARKLHLLLVLPLLEERHVSKSS